jgi:hypothetical protein
MPRKRKAARQFRHPNELTQCQREILFFGEPLIPRGPTEAFSSAADIERAWRAHRAALMAAFDLPGQRPWAFWRVEIGLDPAPERWWEQAAELERLGLLSPAEEIRLERERPELAEDQGSLNATVLANPWGAYVLEGMRGRFGFAAAWHGRRGRTQLKEKYLRLAEAAGRALKESTDE